MPEYLDISSVEHLTLGEMELVEEYGGAPLSKLQADAAPDGEGVYRVRFARAVGLVMLRRRARANGLPDPTWEDAGELQLPEPEAEDDADAEVGTTAPDPIPVGRRRRAG